MQARCPDSWLLACHAGGTAPPFKHELFADPGVGFALPPLDEFAVVEEDGDLSHRRFRAVGAVDEVAPDLDGQITANSARRRAGGVCCSYYVAAERDRVPAFPDHGHHRAGGDEADQPFVKRLALVRTGVLFGKRRGDIQELEPDKLEPAPLEAGDHLAYKPALNAVRFN